MRCDKSRSLLGVHLSDPILKFQPLQTTGAAIMTLSSYSDVFGISHEREFDEEIRPGDLVATGANLHPYFEVLAVNGDKAWVRNVQNGADHLALLSRCRRLGGALEGLAMAAE